MNPLRRILVATDFGEAAAVALQRAVALAQAQGAELLLLLHVIPPWPYPLGATDAGASGLPTLFGEVRRSCEERLAELCRREVPTDVPSRTLVREGTPYAEIVRAAREEKADLIAVAPRNRSALETVLLGSTAEKVARKAACSVLIVRE